MWRKVESTTHLTNAIIYILIFVSFDSKWYSYTTTNLTFTNERKNEENISNLYARFHSVVPQWRNEWTNRIKHTIRLLISFNINWRAAFRTFKSCHCCYSRSFNIQCTQCSSFIHSFVHLSFVGRFFFRTMLYSHLLFWHTRAHVRWRTPYLTLGF